MWLKFELDQFSYCCYSINMATALAECTKERHGTESAKNTLPHWWLLVVHKLNESSCHWLRLMHILLLLHASYFSIHSCTLLRSSALLLYLFLLMLQMWCSKLLRNCNDNIFTLHILWASSLLAYFVPWSIYFLACILTSWKY